MDVVQDAAGAAAAAEEDSHKVGAVRRVADMDAWLAVDRAARTVLADDASDEAQVDNCMSQMSHYYECNHSGHGIVYPLASCCRDVDDLVVEEMLRSNQSHPLLTRNDDDAEIYVLGGARLVAAPPFSMAHDESSYQLILRIYCDCDALDESLQSAGTGGRPVHSLQLRTGKVGRLVRSRRAPMNCFDWLAGQQESS